MKIGAPRWILLWLAPLAGLAAGSNFDLNLQFFRDLTETRSYTLGRPIKAQITPDEKSVIYLRSGPRNPVLHLYEFDIATKTERELLTPAQLLGAKVERLSIEEKARRERERMSLKGFTKFELSQDGSLIMVTLSGQLYVINRARFAANPSDFESIQLLPDENWIDARISPDASAVSAVKDDELFVIDLATNEAKQLTNGAHETLSHATAEFVAQEEMDRSRGYWWSPDSQEIAYQETDQSGVDVRYVADALHPEEPPTKFFFPKAGSTNATVRLGVISRHGGPTRWIKWDSDQYPYLTKVVWEVSSAPLCFLVQDRAQQHQILFAVDQESGDIRELLRESDSAWINLDSESEMPRWLDDGQHFIWTTESSGHWQVELRRRDGTFVHAITPANFIYKGILGVDAARRVVYLSGSTHPVDTHIWKFPLAQGPGTPLTTARGHHSATLADLGGVLIHTFDLLNGQNGSEIWDPSGKVLAALPSVAERPRTLPNVEITETFGHPSFHAAIVRPKDFQPHKSYPVILEVYAGPTVLSVKPNASAYLTDQWTADQGYIVVQIDGRGTPHRGRDWERIIRGNLIDVALQDQIDGLLALGQRYPEFDLSRVGVAGWSFGGYFSAMAVARRPDIFRCGVVGAPVTTWENYDTFYTERYLGLPQESPEAYRVSNVLTYLDQLQRPLLIVHGMNDDNVYFQHALQLVDTLFLSGKPYEFLPMLGTHMISDPMIRLREKQRIMDFLERNLQDTR